jgi:hypothetical protein
MQCRNESGPERNALFFVPRKAIPIAHFYVASHRVKAKATTFPWNSPLIFFPYQPSAYIL